MRFHTKVPTLRQKPVLVGLAGVCTVAVVGAGVFMWNRPAPHEVSIDDAAPRMAPTVSGLSTYRAGPLSLQEVTEGVHIVVTWATWCRPCEMVLRDLERLLEEYSSAPPVVAVNRAEPDTIARGYVERQFQDSALFFVSDDADRYFKDVEGYAMPELLIVSAQGEIMYHHRGPIGLDELVAQLQSLELL